MLGHLYYSNRQNDKAFQYFDSVKDQDKFSKLVRPYYVQMYYNDKNYDQAITEGNALLTKIFQILIKRKFTRSSGRVTS